VEAGIDYQPAQVIYPFSKTSSCSSSSTGGQTLLRGQGEFLNTTTICVLAETEEVGEEHKDTFYDHLDRLYLRAPKHDIKILVVMGDFDAEVGKENFTQQMWKNLTLRRRQVTTDGG
jgi:hypothetical protein